MSEKDQMVAYLSEVTCPKCNEKNCKLSGGIGYSDPACWFFKCYSKECKYGGSVGYVNATWSKNFDHKIEISEFRYK